MDDELKKCYERGMRLFDEGKYVEAEALLKKVVAGNYTFADVMNKLGLIAHDQRRYKTAVDYFEAAIKQNPRYTEAGLNLAITYNEMGESDKASDVFDTMMTDTPDGLDGLDPFAAGKIANEHFKCD
jgi:tetratricopeptide (TPR) repeat protein